MCMLFKKLVAMYAIKEKNGSVWELKYFEVEIMSGDFKTPDPEEKI